MIVGKHGKQIVFIADAIFVKLFFELSSLTATIDCHVKYIFVAKVNYFSRHKLIEVAPKI